MDQYYIIYIFLAIYNKHR